MSSSLLYRSCLAAIVVTILGACDHSKPADTPLPRTSCAQLKRELPSDFIQGMVSVPEDYGAPNGRHIKVFYYGRIGSEGNATTVFFNGGPGGDSHSSFQSLNQVTDATAERKAQIPILYIDQRGTGCSDNYLVPETPSDLVRLSHYGSTEIVKDSEVIRKKLLGSARWKVFGQSFGGTIAKRYLEVAPEGVRSLHIHGFSSTNDQMDYIVARLRSQHRLMEEFLAIYPGARQDYLKIESLLDDSICVQDGADKFCGKQILYSMTLALGFHNHWSWMHSSLESFLSRGKLNRDGLMRYAKLFLFGNEEQKGSWSGLIINWVDQGLASFSLKTCTEAYARLTSQGERPTEWPLHECKLTMTNAVSGSDNSDPYAVYLEPIPQHLLTLDSWERAIRAHPEVPIFLYSGGKDSFVPVESFAGEIARVGDLIHYTNFPETGHEGFKVESRVWDDLIDDMKPIRKTDSQRISGAQ